MKRTKKPYLPPSHKKQSDDMHRYDGKGMVWRPEDEGPYDRVMGKDMTVAKEDVLPKRNVQKLAKGGIVRGKK